MATHTLRRNRPAHRAGGIGMIDLPENPWRVWRNWRGVRTIAGDYPSRRDAERAIRQLRRINRHSVFTVEFIGKAIAHCSDRGKPV